MRVLLAVTPSPSPSLSVVKESVTPGVVGFLTMALLTVAVVLLILDMTRRIRRVRYRGELADRRAGGPEGRDRP